MEIIQALLPFVWALVISLYAVPSVVDLAWKKGLMDSFGTRKVHNLMTPRLGGVAIFAGTFSGILIFSQVNPLIQYFLAAILLLFFIGVRDDLQEIQTWKKLIVQLIAAFIFLYEGDFLIKSFYGFMGIDQIPIWFGYLLCLVLMTGITNSINFIDGMDGLAGLVTLIPVLSITIYFFSTDYSLSVVGLCLSGSLIGFLPYNLKRSSVFMGDSGSTISGFIISVLCLSLIDSLRDSSGWMLIYALLFVPLTDLVRIVFSRILRRISPFKASRDHIHHILLDSGIDQKKVLLLLCFLSALVPLVSFTLWRFMELDVTVITFGLVLFSIIFIAYCEITFRKISVR